MVSPHCGERSKRAPRRVTGSRRDRPLNCAIPPVGAAAHRPKRKIPIMTSIRLLRRAACALFCLVPLIAGAEALLRPLPTPDTAKLAPELAKEVAAQRAEF